MFKNAFFTLLLFFSIQFVSLAVALPFDSIRTENRNGKTYVVHKVSPKETLFALSRKYHVPVDQIVDANTNIQNGLSVGQLVYIPRKTVAVTPSKPKPEATPRTFVVDDKGNKIHTVEEKQTLYAIARLHEVTPADIKKWNRLTSDNVNVGDKLVVGVGNKPTSNPQYVQEVDDDVDKVKVTPGKTVANTKTTPPATTATTRPAEEVPVKTEVPVVERTKPVETIVVEEDNNRPETISKVTESGLAELIDNRSESNKYLALHKTAPIGTILQVKNIMNNQTVYVRVIGKLPATGANERVIIKISNRAYQKLAALDNRFRVEVSYMP